MTIPVGKVYLVGAGPGDPRLITVQAVECLASADLVLYDYLVNPQLLEHTRPGTPCECLGRHGQGRLVPQEEINARLVAEAQAGNVVVRLKSGDPAIFGRAAEEADALTDAQIPFQIVPGITAVLAAGSYAGVPITHRHQASGIAILTGQQCRDKAEAGLDFRSLGNFPGTLVVYMGVTTAGQWSQQLIEAGKPADTPVAVVRRCSWPDQQVLRCDLGTLAARLEAACLRPPAIIIVGQVAQESPTASWFEARPLYGQTVLITRPAGQSVEMRQPLAELGARIVVQPAIEIRPPEDWTAVDEALARLDQFDWLVFSSANGVRYLLDRLLERGGDLRQLGQTRLAAIGPSTAAALGAYHLRADLSPAVYQAEALAEALVAKAPNGRYLLARASRGREVLAEMLTAAGATVEQQVVYRSCDVETVNPDVQAALHSGKLHWTTVTSSAIARSLMQQFGDDLRCTQLVSISPLTSAVLREAGFEPAAEAAEATGAGVIQAILDAAQASGK